VIVYVDSTVLLRRVLGEDDPVDLPNDDVLVFTSELARVECRRTIDRLRVTGQATGDEVATALHALAVLESGLTFVMVTGDILSAASEPMPSVVGTLDALHLATASALSDGLDEDVVIFLTHDRQQARAARELGFDVRGVAHDAT
jgi:predicted nucleic acid-binding protein